MGVGRITGGGWSRMYGRTRKTHERDTRVRARFAESGRGPAGSHGATNHFPGVHGGKAQRRKLS